MGPRMAEFVAVKDIEPQHPVRQPRRVKALVASMKKRGWVGRPLVVADFGPAGTMLGKRYLALTGTHRLAAVKKMREREIPAEVVDVSRWSYTEVRALDDAVLSEDKAAILEGRGRKKLARWVLEEGWPEYDGPGPARPRR